MHYRKPIRAPLCRMAAALLALAMLAAPYQPARATVIEDPLFVYEQAMYYYEQALLKQEKNEAGQALDDLEQSLRLFLSLDMYADSDEWAIKLELMIGSANQPTPAPQVASQRACFISKTGVFDALGLDPDGSYQSEIVNIILDNDPDGNGVHDTRILVVIEDAEMFNRVINESWFDSEKMEVMQIGAQASFEDIIRNALNSYDGVLCLSALWSKAEVPGVVFVFVDDILIPGNADTAATEPEKTPQPLAISEIPTSTPSPGTSATIGIVTITAGGTVNLRAQGNAESAVVGKAKTGDTFPCSGMADSGWYEIMLTDGTNAYISPKMVAFEENEKGIAFVDPAFEVMLREALGRPEGPIFPSELKNYISVVIDEGIMTLDGYRFSYNKAVTPTGNLKVLDDLRWFQSVLTLAIVRVPVDEITPLAGLTRLSRVSLINTDVTDLSPLTGLSGLESLTLVPSDRVLIDMIPLLDMKALSDLHIRDNGFVDPDLISRMKGLHTLGLGVDSISDLSCLSGLTRLESLILDSNAGVDDLSPIAGLTNLQRLDLGNTGVTDLSQILHLPRLENLGFRGNHFSDLTQLTEFTNLRRLYLSNNGITDLSPLAGMTKLSELYLYNNNITDLTPLSGLHNLEKLDLRENPVTDWSPVEHIPTVQGRPEQ